ncbi:WecB/TagA/CpsF family glycosyltransferase [Segatella bryantii]|uniref:WecB/TagA/CpsF family glycosyltransferase n=1 Tax=Segatella bryantii TaxID=77095 RepID=UPI00241C0DE3|nr:WecB/TagA/CpsF family glycosyltransferase [Segatella bryantii]
MMTEQDRIELNGVKVYPFTSSKELLEFVDQRKGILVAVNAEKVTKATDETRNVINNNIGYADGGGVVVAMHRKGIKNAVRLAGADLWLEIVAQSYKSKTFYIIGGKQDVIDDTIKKLKHQFNGINILGYRNGYIKTPEERQILIDDIADKKPDIVFVAMGSPKQEFLMYDFMKVNPAIYQGLGGSFDVYTGRVKRAPLWWQTHNLEFLYRFLKQPSRYRREYYRLKFLAWMLMGKFK